VVVPDRATKVASLHAGSAHSGEAVSVRLLSTS
jgi:hypothetical protein